MTLAPVRLFSALLVISCAALPLPALADVKATIAKARAYLGGDAALNRLNSIHYTGTLTTSDPGNTASIEIIFQKPYQQRIVAKSDKGIEITALDSYDAWQRVQDASDASRWKMDLLGKEQLKRLRANTWENLSFFRGIEQRGGRVDDLGMTEVDGVSCRKLAFIHEPGIVFYRYFNESNGKLLLTETDQGGSIREEGEIVVEGIRFPQRVITVTKLADGKELSVTVTFDKIVLNEKFPAELFSVPSLIGR